jgi:hypothetical protein
MSYQFRKVNNILGASPKIGPFPSEIAIPCIFISLGLFFISYSLFQLSWLMTFLLIAWGDVTWWILIGSKPYKFLSKFIPVPRWSRGIYRYQSINIFCDKPSNVKPKKLKKF